MSGELEDAVAIVGVGCVLPDAFDVQSFWRNARAGHRALRPLQERWRWPLHHDPSGADPDRAVSIRGAQIEGWALDWRRYRIPPADVAAINPLALMTLDAGSRALEAVRELDGRRAGIFLGATGFGWQRDAALRIRLDALIEAAERAVADAGLDLAHAARLRARLDERLGPVTDDAIVNGPSSVAAGRIAMRHDLRGLHYAVDAGFASGLAALEAGVRALRDGTLDVALVGGASELLAPVDLVAFSRLGGLARGDVRPFDAAAEGTLLGEGVAMFALRRLADAVRLEDEIIAVVRGVAGGTDGRTRSLLAPDPDGQVRVMERALSDAGVAPGSVRWVECHATGTPVGDRSELEATARVYGGATPWVTSAKASVGHLRGGAGAVGLLRVALGLRDGVVPGQPGFSEPSAALLESGLRVPPHNEPLDVDDVARAAVSAYSFGGVGYHAILERYDPRRHRDARAPRQRPRAPIAIVGMGGRFPGADDVPTFWERLLEGHDATREIPKERWDVDRYYAARPEVGAPRADKSYTRLGCFLDALPSIDPRWGIPPSAGASLDPSHLVCLAAAEEAIRDAGLEETWEGRARTSVHLAFLPYQGKRFLADVRVNAAEVGAELEAVLAEAGVDAARAEAVAGDAVARFRAALPAMTEDTLTGYLGSLNAGRVARLYDLHGAHATVDAACASGHAAVHAAVTALRHGVSDWALTGGVWADMQPEFFVGACRFDALSATGSTPFDARADGFIPGEGGGVLVLRRLDDAVAAGQRVHAVIRGVAGASDGAGRSVLAPTEEGEASAMRAALEDAGIEGADVGYVECHGTGTALGDVVEVAACQAAFGVGREDALRIGSVKSNIGHLNAAAGIAGLVKAALAVREGVIPPSLKVETPNPKVDFTRGPVEVVRALTRWDRPPGAPRRAGVSSFGVGGANMHLVVEEYRPSVTVEAPRPAEPDAEDVALLPLAMVAGADLRACVAHMEALLEDYGREGPSVLERARGEGSVRACVVVSDAPAFARRTRLLANALEAGDGHRLGYLRAQGIFVGRRGARVAATFPGQGPQYPNMGRELAAADPSFAAALDEADEAYAALTGRTLRAAMWTDDPDGWTQRDEDIHCAVMAINVGLARSLMRRGMRPSCLVGQSAGELSALVVAGAMSFADGLRACWERTRAVLALETDDPGAMLAISAGSGAVEPHLAGLPGYAAVAAHNGPAACIVSGDAAALAALAPRLAAAGLDAQRLAVSHGYHSRLIAGAMPAYRAALATLRFREPSIAVMSTITGRALTTEALADHLPRQFVEPVRLVAAIEAAWTAGARVFVECGPKWSLTQFTEAILGEREQVSVASIHPKIGEREQLARALAALAVRGHLDAWPRLSDRRSLPPALSSPLPLPSTPSPPTLLRPALEAIARGAAELEDAEPTREALLDALRQIRTIVDDVLEGERTAARALAVNDVPRAPSPLPPPLPPPARHLVRVPRPRPAPVDDVASRLRAAFAQRTGYPEEMLEPGLDLEADLGIDTVKQVAVLSEVRAALGLEVDEAFVLRDHPTLGALAAYLAQRVPAAVSEAPPAPEPAASAEVLARLRAELAQRTGYPEEMLEVDLDLEADLGIDTVKQVAVLAAIREALGLELDPTFELRRTPTLRLMADHLAARMGHPAAAPPSAPPAVGETRAAILGRLAVAFAERTGYPEEMLESQLDLEADLGIDTVKQVAVLASVREALGLELDPTFELRRHPTLGELAEYFAERLGMPPRSRPPTRPSEASRARGDEVDELLSRLFAERTGYPEEMLEPDLELEADLGIDTVKQVAVLGEARRRLSLPLDPDLVLREHPTLRALGIYLRGRLGAGIERVASSIPPRPTARRGEEVARHAFTARGTGTVPALHRPGARRVGDERLLSLAFAAVGPGSRVGPIELREPALIASGQRVELTVERGRELGEEELVVRVGDAVCLSMAASGGAPEDAPRMSAELERAFERLSGEPPNAGELAEHLGRPEPWAGWARAHRWDVVIGRHSVPDEPLREEAWPARAAGLALWYASLSWARLLGTPHLVRRIGAVEVIGAPPTRGIHAVATLAARGGGRARARVELYALDGAPLARVIDIEGVAVGAPGRDLSEGGAVFKQWRRLARRLEGRLLPGEDAGW